MQVLLDFPLLVTIIHIHVYQFLVFIVLFEGFEEELGG